MRRLILTVLFTGSLGGCALIYQPTIRQGNIITPQQMAQLKPGMHTSAVRYLLGTSVLEHRIPGRWEYLQCAQHGKAKPNCQRLRLFFIKDVLQKIEVSPGKPFPENRHAI
jgi:outer membrane protein assembly factor BamE